MFSLMDAANDGHLWWRYSRDFNGTLVMNASPTINPLTAIADNPTDYNTANNPTISKVGSNMILMISTK